MTKFTNENIRGDLLLDWHRGRALRDAIAAISVRASAAMSDGGVDQAADLIRDWYPKAPLVVDAYLVSVMAGLKTEAGYKAFNDLLEQVFLKPDVLAPGTQAATDEIMSNIFKAPS